ncbi:hypothetical protein [Actinomadura sp. 9N215]
MVLVVIIVAVTLSFGGQTEKGPDNGLGPTSSSHVDQTANF